MIFQKRFRNGQKQWTASRIKIERQGAAMLRGILIAGRNGKKS
jgi:hypothetical protein